MADADKQGFWSHWPALAGGIAALLTAIGTLIAGLAAGGLIGGGSADNGPSPQVSDRPSEITTDARSLPFEATADEQRLANMIPLIFHPDCERADGPAGAIASIFCHPPEVGGVAYRLFDSVSGLNAHMKPRLSMGDTNKQCGEDPSGSSTYRNTEDETIGRLVCYIQNGQAWVEWTNLKTNVYAYAFRKDKNWRALFNFWRGAGPRPANE